MITVWFYTLVSVFLISFLSLVGVFTLSISKDRLKKFLIYFISFSAGALLGDVFIHLLPEVIETYGFNLTISLFILTGILVGFFVEKVICWRHCHLPINKNHVHRYAYMNLFGDMVHNFIDGLIVGASFLASIPIGIATTSAVILHEIPQEIGDFGVLLHGGFSKTKALFYNFATALTAIIGAVVALLVSVSAKNINLFLIPFAAGSFIYIAGSDLIPELHKEEKVERSLIQILFFVLGIGIMLSLLLVG